MAKPDVRVRLTAEGVQEVVQALKRIAAESDKSGKKASKSFGLFGQALGNVKTLLGGMAGYLSFRMFQGFIRGGSEAADQIGKLALRVGTTVERASALSWIAKKSDVDLNALAGTAGILTRRIQDLRDGLPTMVEQFGKLEIAAEDLEGLDTAQALALVAERLYEMEDGSKRSGIALTLLGRAGGKIIPALNELGAQGLPRIVEGARELGLVLDEETTDSIIALNDDMATLEMQVDFLAARFLAGLAPAIRQAVGMISGDLAEGSQAFKDFGEDAGRMLTGLILAFATLAEVIMTAFDWVGTLLGTTSVNIVSLAKYVFKSLKGEKDEALRDLGAAVAVVDEQWEALAQRIEDRNERMSKRIKALLEGEAPPASGAESEEETEEERERRLRRIQDQAQMQALIERQAAQQSIATIKARATLAREAERRAYEQGLQDVETYYAARRKLIEEQAQAELAALQQQLELLADEGDPERRQLEEARVNAEIQRARLSLQTQLLQLTGEEQKEIERVGRERLKVESKIQTSNLETHELRLEQIRREAEAYNLLLTQQGVGEAQRAELVANLRETLLRREDFDTIAREAQAGLDELALARAELDAQVLAGNLTQMQSEQQLNAILREKVPFLREIAYMMQAAAAWTKDPALVAQAQAFSTAITELEGSTKNLTQTLTYFRDSMEQAATSDLTNWLSSLGDQTENARQAFTRLALSVVKSLQRIAAEIIATAAIKRLSGLFGGGGAPGERAATGKLIRGPGGPTGDKIPAYLSDWEYVVQASQVKRPGGLQFLRAYNAGLIDPRQMLHAVGLARGGLPRFRLVTATGLAGGGTVTRPADLSSATGAAGEGRLLIGLEEGLVSRVLESAEGQRLVVQAIAKNRRTVSRLWR